MWKQSITRDHEDKTLNYLASEHLLGPTLSPGWFGEGTASETSPAMPYWERRARKKECKEALKRLASAYDDTQFSKRDAEILCTAVLLHHLMQRLELKFEAKAGKWSEKILRSLAADLEKFF